MVKESKYFNYDGVKIPIRIKKFIDKHFDSWRFIEGNKDYIIIDIKDFNKEDTFTVDDLKELNVKKFIIGYDYQSMPHFIDENLILPIPEKGIVGKIISITY